MKKITKEEYLDAVFVIEAYHKQILNEIVAADKAEEFLSLYNPSKAPILHSLIKKGEISVRLYNILAASCVKIGLCRTYSDINFVTADDLHKIKWNIFKVSRNVGERSKKELETLCLKYEQKMDYESAN